MNIKILSLLALWVAISHESFATLAEIDGFGGYKFGMTIDEARQVRDDDRETECTYKDALMCFEYMDNIEEESVKVEAIVDEKTKKIRSVRLAFKKVDGGCDKTAESLSKYLDREYPSAKVEGTLILNVFPKVTMTLEEGGKVTIRNFCRQDKGDVTITYEP